MPGTMVVPVIPPFSYAPSSSGKAAYTYSISGTAPYATPTDWVVLRGSATKTIKVVHLEISGAATAASSGKTCTLKKHTIANTGGTATNPAAMQHDSADGAASGLILLYSVAPTIDATATIWKTIRYAMPVVAAATLAGAPSVDRWIWDITDAPYEPIVLRGVAQEFAINFNSVALLSGEVDDFSVTWTEE